MSAPFTHAAYADLLTAGLDAGYRFAGFDELPVLRCSSERACLLRHDCDNDLVAAARMAEIEAARGVRSTYFLMLRSALYNLLAPTNLAMVRTIVGHGHALGLHFDESVVRDLPPDQVALAVDHERAWLATEFGVPVDVVSFHQPGPRVLHGDMRLSCVNTYDARDLAGVHYTSDSNLRFRSGEPAALFASGQHRLLQVLIHAEWWTEEPMLLAGKWERVLEHNFGLMQDSLLQREDTYNQPRHLTFAPLPSHRLPGA